MSVTREEVRAWLERTVIGMDSHVQSGMRYRMPTDVYEHAARCARAALDALEDAERLDWIIAQDRAVEIGPWEWSPTYDKVTLRAAIDAARREADHG